MKHFLLLMSRTFGVSFSTMLVYRSNVFFFFIFETLFLVSQFLAVSVGFDLAGDEIAGWTRDQAYLLTAVNGLSHQLFICIFINPIFNVGLQVWNGQFDYVLLKPLHPFVSMIANGQLVVSNIPNMVINLVLVLYFLGGGASYPYSMLPLFALFVLLGLLVRVGLALLCMAPVFFSERLSDVEDSFWSVSNLARYPLSIYPRSLEAVLTFVIPVGMLASLPASTLFHERSIVFWLGALGSAAAFSFLCLRAFLGAVRHYQSVNSGA